MSLDIYATLRRMTRRILLALLPLTLTVSAAAQTPAQAPDGAALFQGNCASCHLTGANRAPDMEVLRAMSADRVLAAMETGPMVAMATGRSAADRRAIAESATGKKLRNTLEMTPLPKAMCTATNGGTTAFTATSGPAWT